ncbi:hypothetical protein [Variovorax sp. DXTD-1]|uniref:hypothetical protein n=1 Tax=Variovorax sp. DXTD-1 TaxID=2495592 RepID=UPI000F88947C|nr:hypothetical protein [Variovorax sp. DXTD-1]RST46317.1 hypothetical protein EJI00_21555 [Variovorax sp. DXTD-1]
MKTHFLLSSLLVGALSLTGCIHAGSPIGVNFQNGKTYEQLVAAMGRNPTKIYTNKAGNKVASFFYCRNWEVSGTYGGGYFTPPYAEARMSESRFEFKSGVVIDAKRLVGDPVRGSPNTDQCGHFDHIDTQE